MTDLRFDDSLETVLSAEMSSPLGAELAWRQLVDLIGRGRVAATEDVIARLRMIRCTVPPPVRTASARSVATASPPLGLVVLFAEDEIAVAAPVLRSAQLATADWAELLPMLSPTGRSILRHRRDLPAAVQAMLDSFGSVDFVLASPIGLDNEVADGATVSPAVDPLPTIETTDAAIWSNDAETVDDPSNAVAFDAPVPPTEPATEPATDPATGPFEIAELLKRISAYQRDRDGAIASGGRVLDEAPFTGSLDDESCEPRADRFRFETDSAGSIRWVDGVSRTALVGVSLARAAVSGASGNAAAVRSASGVDGAVAGAFRQRAAFVDLRLTVAGHSDAAGNWRISAVPVFDRATGRFTGYRGSARRPRVDEAAEPQTPSRGAVADALRQLVHELRTPTNAIAGFAEMIEAEMLGPVPDIYRDQATAIRSQTAGLLGAIEDMDTAARIETNALQLHADDIPVTPLLDRIASDLAPLATLRGATIALHIADDRLAIRGDGRAVERLIGRLLATLVAVAGARERIAVVVSSPDPKRVSLAFERPVALAGYVGDALLAIAPEDDAVEAGAPLLGTGFSLRLTRNLAAELDGTLTIAEDSLTLHLPAVTNDVMEQTTHNGS